MSPIKTHGHKTRDNTSAEYVVWQSMRQRCGNPNNDSYPNYGGRGIEVCKRWDRFENFLEDMGPRPDEKLRSGLSAYSIERIDNDKGYSPDNCRWDLRSAQGNNTRKNVRLTYKGKEQTLMQWSKDLGIPHGVLWMRLYDTGWTVDRALSTPHKPRAELIVDGVTQSITQWAESSGTSYSTIHRRHKQGWPDREAVYGRL